MGTTSSISPGIANLLQTLSSVDGPIASSPGLAAALEKAPPSDIVQLSIAATQLQTVSSLFGGGTDSTSSANPFAAGTNNNDFTNLESVLTGSSGPTSESAQAAAQLQNVDSLFGIADSTNTNTTEPLSIPSGATAAQLAQYEALQQIQTTQSLFGTAGTNVLG
ncbi:MAG TPA: hypothetical protein VGL53_16345 [Bryobacteraceae bacterium]|jgi:hypothetical protein